MSERWLPFGDAKSPHSPPSLAPLLWPRATLMSRQRTLVSCSAIFLNFAPV